jgi:hypothetical protein
MAEPAGCRAPGSVSAAIAHAVDFHTWRSLVGEGGLSRAQAVRLVSAMIEAA